MNVCREAATSCLVPSPPGRGIDRAGQEAPGVEQNSHSRGKAGFCGG